MVSDTRTNCLKPSISNIMKRNAYLELQCPVQVSFLLLMTSKNYFLRLRPAQFRSTIRGVHSVTYRVSGSTYTTFADYYTRDRWPFSCNAVASQVYTTLSGRLRYSLWHWVGVSPTGCCSTNHTRLGPTNIRPPKSTISLHTIIKYNYTKTKQLTPFMEFRCKNYYNFQSS